MKGREVVTTVLSRVPRDAYDALGGNNGPELDAALDWSD